MFVSRVISRITRKGLNQCRVLISSRPESPLTFYINNFHSLTESSNMVFSLPHPVLNNANSRGFWFSSSASPQPTDKETNQRGDSQEVVGDDKADVAKANVDDKAAEKTEDADSGSEPKPSMSESVKKRRKSTKRTAFSDSDSDTERDLSIEDLIKLVAEKEELLKLKHKEIEIMQEKVLRTYAEMENVLDRTRREAENSKKFAIQNFAKALLDVADNLGRASSVVKDSFSKIDQSKDTVGAVPLLKTLLEGVEMTEKQLSEVFRKFGVEKFDPINEQFDPHRHNAVFQIPDGSKPSGTIAVVLKPGYMLYDRVIRPAEVGVTVALDNETEQSSEA